MILLIDNYDSFTYNLVQYLGELGATLTVKRNNALSCDEAMALNPQAVVLSPGPCNPNKAGICLDLVKAVATAKLPLLGVCLGHQSIAQAFGGHIIQCHEIMHGKLSKIYHQDDCLFMGLPSPFLATRYHSLIVENNSLPDDLTVTAWTDNDVIMAIKHKYLPIYGVQFHPESIKTDFGHKILGQFLAVI